MNTSTTGGESSILRCIFGTQHSSTTFSSPFKFPAKYQPPTVHFGAKVGPTFALPPSSDEYGNDNGNINSYGRRRLVILSTTLSLFPLQEYVKDYSVEAKEFEATDYLLIKDEIRKVLSKAKAAGVLRLVFHDAGTFEVSENSGGMNGSITYELERPENKGLKKSLKILEKAKNVVDETKSVSWADMIALAGAEAVSICGGPEIPVRLGRLDSLNPDPEGKLPEESLDAPSLKQCFQRKGFS